MTAFSIGGSKRRNANGPQKGCPHMFTYMSSVAGLSHIMYQFFTACLFSNLKMEAAISSDIFVRIKTTRRYTAI
jgi:hypothetical protein